MNEPDAPGIAADISCLAPGSYINRRLVAPAPRASRRARPWRVPHSAFRDTTRPDAKPRASTEFRTVAYFS